MDLIYLDNNATTRPLAEVVEAMRVWLTEEYGNPSSLHAMGQQARYAVESARDAVAELIGAKSNSVIFTSCGTEAINTVIRSALGRGVPRIITSTVEHPATLAVCEVLEKQKVEIERIPVDSEGALDFAKLEEAASRPAALATFMSANNETGVLFDIPAISAICRKSGVPLHVDATQSAGKVAVNVGEWGVDAMTCSAHKFHGPKGVGALYVGRKMPFTPLLLGGSQEIGRRGGTENVPAIVGAGVASRLAKQSLPLENLAGLRDRLEREIVARIPDSAILAGKRARLPNTTLVAFRALQSQAVLMALSEQGVCASAGSACASGSLEPSHVLKAMKIDEKLAFGAVRFSLSKFTTAAEIERTLEVLPGVIERLRRTLPAN